MKLITDFKKDAVRATEHYEFIEDYDIRDISGNMSPHRDGIQLIPPHHNVNAQFAASELRGVTIRNNKIFSDGKLQGIFASDGLFVDLRILDNTISTLSEHKITINGMLSGHIEGNTKGSVDEYGDLISNVYPVSVVLNPLRIGGNSDGSHNVWVLSFTDREYETITGQDVIDNRTINKEDGDIYLYDFDLEGFRNAASKSVPGFSVAVWVN